MAAEKPYLPSAPPAPKPSKGPGGSGKKRGQLTKTSATKKAQRGVEMADKLARKQTKTTLRKDRKKRAKE